MWHDNEETYELPWSRSTGSTGLRQHSQITEKAIIPLTKDEILSVYDKDTGTTDDMKGTPSF